MCEESDRFDFDLDQDEMDELFDNLAEFCTDDSPVKPVALKAHASLPTVFFGNENSEASSKPGPANDSVVGAAKPAPVQSDALSIPKPAPAGDVSPSETKPNPGTKTKPGELKDKDKPDEALPSRTLGGDAKSEVELFRQRLQKAGIDPDKLSVRIGIYEPVHADDKEGKHAELVTAMINDSKVGLSRKAGTTLVNDREIEVKVGSYLGKENGLDRFIQDYAVAGMDSLTRALQKHCIDSKDPNMKVFNVSQAFSPIWCLKDAMKDFEKDPERFAPFIKQLLGDEKGQQFVDQVKKLNDAMKLQQQQYQRGEVPTPINEHPDRKLKSELMQKLYDKIESTLDGNKEFATAMKNYRDKTKECADRGIVVVVAVGNDGDFGKFNDIKVKPGAEYNWYAMSDHVIAVGASDINGTPGDRSDDTVWACSSHGTERWHPTVIVQGSSIPVEAALNGSINGTSFAAPQISATVALMLEQNPRLTFAQVKAMLERGATPLRGVSPTVQGAGVLELERPIIAARDSRK